MKIYLIIAIFLLATLAERPLFAGDVAVYKEPDAFSKNYLHLSLARNFPVSLGQRHFDPGYYHPFLSFRHNLDAHWIMGLGTQFKIFYRSDYNEDIAIWTIIHEAFYKFRISHPVYLLAGPQFHYLLPAKIAKFPIQRENDFKPEIGVGFTMALGYVTPSSWLATIALSRWRGTGSNMLHAIEINIGIGIPLK